MDIEGDDEETAESYSLVELKYRNKYECSISMVSIVFREVE